MIPKGREMVGIDNVFNKYGIYPKQFCDFQAIMGDKVVRIGLFLHEYICI